MGGCGGEEGMFGGLHWPLAPLNHPDNLVHADTYIVIVKKLEFHFQIFSILSNHIPIFWHENSNL